MLDPHLLPASGDSTEEQAGCWGDEANTARDIAGRTPPECHYSGVAYCVSTTARTHVQGQQDLRVLRQLPSLVWAGEVTWPGGTCDGPGTLGFASRRRPLLGGIRHGAASEVQPGCPRRPPSPRGFVWRAAPTARRPPCAANKAGYCPRAVCKCSRRPASRRRLPA